MGRALTRCCFVKRAARGKSGLQALAKELHLTLASQEYQYATSRQLPVNFAHLHTKAEISSALSVTIGCTLGAARLRYVRKPEQHMLTWCSVH